MTLYLTKHRNFRRPPAGQRQRRGSGNYEQMVNRQQRALVRAYDSWAGKIRKEIQKAAQGGASLDEQRAILRRGITLLERELTTVARQGITRSGRVAAGSRFDSEIVQRIIRQEERKITEAVHSSLIPHIDDRLTTAIMLGNAFVATQLLSDFNATRVMPAQYAGAAWVAIFEVQKGQGRQREAERRAEGLDIEPVRWVLDPAAEHCHASAGYYGCVDLAKVYKGGWSQLPTVPAGQVTCRGNCRCHLEVYRDGQWRRGVYDD